MLESWTPEIWIALVAAALLVGAGLGSWFGGRRGRVALLQQELDEAQASAERVQGELDGYRNQVTDHFAETSEKLHDLTLQYRNVYEHLARGASELCPEGFEQLEGGLGLDALPEEAPESPAPAPADEPELPLGEPAGAPDGARPLGAAPPDAAAPSAPSEETDSSSAGEPEATDAPEAGGEPELARGEEAAGEAVDPAGDARPAP